MSLYPSLEDMKIDQLSKVQNEVIARSYANPYESNTSPAYNSAAASPESSATSTAVYPDLGDYMGLELHAAVIEANMPEYNREGLKENTVLFPFGMPLKSNVPSSGEVRLLFPSGLNGKMIAPLSGQSLGLTRAQVTHGIRELILCKDKDDKVGLRVKPINNGIFVCLVIDKSPAAIAGLRFGDQILQINGTNVAGYNMDKVHDLFRKSPVNGISVAVRDRPFERTLTLHKDSTNHVGFHFKNGKITSLVKDSSAARNGVLTDHQILEIDGQNVVGMKDKEVTKLIEKTGDMLTITVIPSFLYEHMIKKMSGSVLKDLMDHSVPNL